MSPANTAISNKTATKTNRAIIRRRRYTRRRSAAESLLRRRSEALR